MRKIALIVIIIFSIIAGYLVVKFQKEKLKSILKFSLKEIVKDITKKTQPREQEPEETHKPEEPPATVILHLKHGGVITGKLLGKTEKDYTVDWNGQKFVIDAGRITRVEYKTQKDIEWPYKNDAVVKRTNGIIMDGEIIDVGEDEITLLFTEGGGSLEMAVNRQDVESLMFAPVHNIESQEIESRLKKLFPKMKLYKEDNVTILTDSHITSVRWYRSTIRSAYTEIYLKFFKLFKGRSPAIQNFVVVFDDFTDYAEYAITDGVPFWAVVGYFSPVNNSLYTFNAFGEKIENIMFEAIIGRTGKALDEAARALKERFDERYHMSIDGQVEDLKERYWKPYSLCKDELTEMTLSTLRHELTHEVFHNLGLQNIVISKLTIDKEELIEKKKEFLETEDPKKKEELLMELVRLKKSEIENIDIEKARSWLSEGTATYCETEPIGSINEMWLFRFQEMARKNEINPIEFLTSFKMGSFPGLCSEGTLNAYAESWAFTTFLMDKYPNQFMDYQKKMAEQKPETDDEELQWLLDSLNKDLTALENEFRSYMDTFKEIEDPYVKRVAKWHRTWDEL